MANPPDDASPRVSVIIPNWNGWELLRPCLESLRKQTYRNFEVIVVDNASSDNSAAEVRAHFPEMRVLSLGHNGGYSAGCNAGIYAARGDILVMLNNDTEADPGWIQALVKALDRCPDAGSAASRMMIFRDRATIHSAGDLYRRDGSADSRGVWQSYGPPYDEERYVFGGCGGAVAYRRAMIEAVGAFEERFFMYCEDVDINWRAQLAGWPCIYVPDAVIYHHLSATGGGALASYYVGRNALWVIARDYPSSLLKRYWRSILASQWRIARQALRAIRGQAARATLRGQIAGLFTCWRWLGARRAIQAQRRVSDEYLESILD